MSTTSGDIELSAEAASETVGGNFHNLVGSLALKSTDGVNAVKAGTEDPGTLNHRFLIFSSDAKLNFDMIFEGNELSFHGLGVAYRDVDTGNDVARAFLADQIIFNTRPTPIIRKDNRPDNGTGNGFVFVQQQTIQQTDETAKFFLDLLKLTIFSGVDATAEVDKLPPERPPTIWTSSYHIYLLEQQQKEEEEKKRRRTMAEQLQLDSRWEASL